MKRRAEGIPLRVKASQAVSRHEAFSGSLPFGKLPRLAATLAGTDGKLQVELQATRDEEGQDWLHGEIRGRLPLTCQRGLHAFDWDCDVALSLALVASESEERDLLKDSESYLVEDDELPLRDLVEDEVLLALPMMPRCDDPECINRLTRR
ncbi:MAG: YceD family protein [Gammaproteobacteria bacterium]